MHLMAIFITGLFSFCPIINATLPQTSNSKVEIQSTDQNNNIIEWRSAYAGTPYHSIVIETSGPGPIGKIHFYKSGFAEISVNEAIRVREISVKDLKTNVITKVSFVTEDELKSGEPNIHFYIKNKNDIGKLIELLDNGESILVSMSNESGTRRFLYKQTKYLKNAIRTYFNMSTEEMNKIFMTSSTDENKPNLANRKAFFPGGEKELKGFLISRMQYPSPDLMSEKKGTVSVAFVINEDGYVDPESVTITKSLNKYLDFAVKQVVAQKMPKWEPAINNGHFVSQKETLSFNFNLSD